MNQIKVNLIKYSESFETKKRLATFTIQIPKFIWGHIISHRALSRNSASSRAIPAKRIRDKVIHNPFIPVYFGENQPGMKSGSPIHGMRLFLANKLWRWSRWIPVLFHYLSEKVGVHKEVINRLIEPWLMVDVIVTATEWNNFLSLRMNDDAQPEIREVANQINTLLKNQNPDILNTGEWHLPFIMDNEANLDIEVKKKISAARCARVSYSLFNGKVSDLESDIRLCEKLSSSGHWSPFEHVATPTKKLDRFGNFIAWMQFRKEFETENGGDYK